MKTKHEVNNELVVDFTFEILRDSHDPEGWNLEFFQGEFDDGIEPDDPELRERIVNIMDIMGGAGKLDQLSETADALAEERDEYDGELYPDCGEKQEQLRVLEKGLEKWNNDPKFREAVIDRMVGKYREGCEAEQEREAEPER